MDGIIYNDNRPRSKPLNNILTKENYKWLVIAIGIGWQIEYEQYKQMFKLSPEWATQGEYLAHLWQNHNRVNPFFVKNLQKACDEKILSDNRDEFLKLKDLLSRFSKTQNRSRKIQNDYLLIEFEKLRECISQLQNSVSDKIEIENVTEKLQSTLNSIIQDWKENNSYIFFKNGKWHNRHHEIIADPTEFLSSDEIEAFENELEQTENQLKIFNGFRIEFDKHMSIIMNIAAQNSSALSKSNSQEKKVEPIAQLKTNLSETQRALLFELLVKGGFIPDENKDCFIWAFGVPNEKRPENFKKIKWNKSKQAFWELLKANSCLQIIDGKRIEKSIIPIFETITNQNKRDIENLFLDKNDHPLNKLSTPKKDSYTGDYTNICNIIYQIQI